MSVSRIKIDDISLQDVYDFMEHGSAKNASPKIVEYLDTLDMTRGLLNRIDRFATKEAVVKHLMVVKDLSRYKAGQIYEETIEYFYRDRIVSKNAWRNIYAEKMEKLVNFSMLIMKDVSDADKISKMIERIASIRQLDIEDLPELPQELFNKPFKVYSLDADISEFTAKADRNKLKKFIEELPELSAKEIARLKEESLIDTLKIFPDEQEDIRKSE
ncbi:hypothetical protein SAMN05216480_10534 [Pustulibacterium marinum]|uniref:Uncharacterized protein n=1 Tax=Pustulibacterium marinum TaxID=1224947 RepID=A0A1I7GKN2_9FLAO|nr:hypothetical protein [Pustulibacterium marinum]SFU48995.1 hypothetical protein SAMN05216480_10534 [Pustulibacterium marinum]